MHGNGLSREERLTGRTLFQELFSQGRSILSEKEKLRAIYIVSETPRIVSTQIFVQFAPAVPKKCGKAFWRNRLKRLLKEAYRHEKEIIIEACKAQNKKLLLVMMPVAFSQKKTPVISLQDVQPYVTSLLTKLKRVV